MRTLIKLLLSLLLLAGLAAGGGYWWFKAQYADKPLNMAKPNIELKVDRGTGIRALSPLLKRQGVDVESWQLELAARMRGDANKIKSGTYELQSPLTLKDLLDQLVAGDVVQFEVKLLEGWTFKQFRQALAQAKELKHQTASWSDKKILSSVGATETHPEGLFFPDTYRFTPGQTDLDILKLAYKQQKARIDKIWATRPADTPLKTPYEFLTLASIVEKETGLEADRDKVAAVFLNRLKIGMRLQSDPTTIYGMGERFDGNIRKRDLETDTPYNTYTRAGLTPTPISAPGVNALKAVMKPAKIDALYFVARGDGTSVFSDTLAQHNRAVDQYQRRKKAAPQ
jgi:UPF0755 protein